MHFKLRKLPKSRAVHLTSFPVFTAEPYRPLPAPVYVLLSRNEKLISVRGPFDFFNAEDIEKMKLGGRYYYGPIMQRVEPFLRTAQEVKKMLGWNQPTATKVLEPTPYEISDAVLRKLGSIWAPIKMNTGTEIDVPIGIESYFALAFVNELCDPISPDVLDYARERDPDSYELALLRSGIFTFLALHLGYLDLSLLNAYRLRFFSEAIQLEGSLTPFSIELIELKKWTTSLVQSRDVMLISSDQFEHSINRVTQKLKARLFRVRNELTDLSTTLAHTCDDGGLGLLRPDEEEEQVGNG